MKITPIRMRRINVGIDTKEAIEKLGVSQSTFYKLEQGYHKPSASLIIRLANVYECTTDDIYKDLKIRG